MVVTPLDKFKRLRRIAWAIFLSLFLWQGTHALTERPSRGDEPQYLNCAVNLIERGVFSGDTPQADEVRPTAYREPAYPLFLALAMLLVQWGPVTTSNGYLLLKGVQYAFVLIAALAAGKIVRTLDGSAVQVWLTRIGIAFSPALVSRADQFDGGNLAVALVPLIALASLRLLSHKRLGFAVLPGGLVAALALTRAAFVYLIPVLGALLWLGLGYRAPQDRRRSTSAVLVFLLVGLVPPTAWMFRNYRQLGHFVLSDRGGVVLTVRAEFDQDLDREEFWAALLYWTPASLTQATATVHFPEARVVRMNWKSSDNYFIRAMQRWELLKKEGQDSLDVDRTLRKEAAGRFLGAPLRHLVASIPVGWRGLFIEQNPEPLRWLNPAAAFNVLLAITLVLLTLQALHRRDPRLLIVVMLAFFPLLFHTLLTENLPRFNEPALPLLWVAVALAPQALTDLRSTWLERENLARS